MTIRHRIAVAIWLFVILLSIAIIFHTRFSADMSAFLPRSPTPGQQVLVDQMQKGIASRLILIALDNAPTAALASLSKELARRLRQDNDFALVNNGEEMAGAADAVVPENDLLWRYRYILSPEVTAARFTAGGLRQALETDLRLLRSDLGMLMKHSLPADPTGEILTLINQFAGQSPPRSNDGVWFSRDDRRALLVVQTRTPGFDIASAEESLAGLDRAFAAARAATQGASAARLGVTGPAVFAVHTKTEMKEDISRLSLIATILVSAILLFTYRSPLILLLALVPVASGALVGVAAVSLGFGFVHGITLGFGVTLIGEAVDYAIYLFTQTAPGTSPSATLPRIWPMLQLGVLISICGFSAMLFSSFTGFAQLGLFSITGLVTAVCVTRWVLPGLLPRDFATARSAIFAPALLILIRRARRLRLPVLLVMLAALLLLALHRGSFWQDDLASLSPIPVADQLLDRSLRADIGAPDVRYLIIASAGDEQTALAMSERLSAALEPLVGQGIITGFDAPSRYLPSDTTQRARLAALPDTATLRENLATALDGLPFQPDLFAPFIADIATAKTLPLLDRGVLTGTSWALRLDSLLFENGGNTWTSLLSLRGVTDSAPIAQAVTPLGIKDVIFVDLKAESDRLLVTYRHEALMLALIGSLVILVLLAAALRSPLRILLVAAPLIGAVLLTTAVLTIGDHRLSIFNLVGLLLTVAVGSNYCIFFERQNWADPQAGRMVASLVLANLCTVIGFGILSFARLPVLHGIGATVAIGAFLSLVLAAVATGARA